MHALERDREERFATCQEFADELERVGRLTGRMASSREVAAYVRGVIGQEIAQQREAVRAWLARSEPSQAIKPENADSPHQSVPPKSGAIQIATGEHSGMVASAASRGAEPNFRAGSKTPVLVVAVALIGVLIVALFLKFGGRAETPTQAVQPAPSPPAAAQPTSEPQPAAVASSPPAAGQAPPSPAASPERPVHAAQPVPYGARPVHRPAPRPAASAPPPAATPAPAAPKPNPADPELDLSSPYR